MEKDVLVVLLVQHAIKPANLQKCFPTTPVANISHLKVRKMNFPQLESKTKKINQARKR